MLEILVHANIGRPPRDLHFAVIDIPTALTVEEILPTDVSGWDSRDMVASRGFGDTWCEESCSGRRPAVLLVPSLVTRIERNVLINPLHPQFSRVAATRAQPVVWDDRRFRR